MKLLLGLLISFAVGVGCRLFDIPVGSPPVIPGALLVLAMTLGYSSTNTFLNRRNRPATTSHLCGGPTGATASASAAEPLAKAEAHHTPLTAQDAKERTRS
jgi:XapX domain-containing protein